MPPKKKAPPRALKTPLTTNPLDMIRRILRSTGFEEEEAYGQAPDEVLFMSREEAEDRADPETVRFAREKAKELESAVPGARARVEVVDEWVSIRVTLPRGAQRNPEPTPEPRTRILDLPPRQRPSLRPGDEVKYVNFTTGRSYEGKAVVTWDHGKSVEALTLPSNEKILLERAADGLLRRFT